MRPIRSRGELCCSSCRRSRQPAIRAGALTSAAIHASLLESELHAAPDTSITEYVERLRRSARPEPARPAKVERAASSPKVIANDATPGDALSQSPVPSLSPAELPKSRRAWLRTSRVAPLAGAAAIVVAVFVKNPADARDMLATEGFTQVTNAAGIELDPAISPDGRMIAYSAGSPGRMHIVLQQLSGQRAIVVSEDIDGEHRGPSWSPDGTQLVFIAQGRTNEIVVIPALGGPPRVLAHSVSPWSIPAWSPDGTWIAWPRGDSLILYSLDGASRALQLPGPELHSISWSPDGRRLVAVRGNPTFMWATSALGNQGPNEIWTVDVRDGSAFPVANSRRLHASPVWSTDGRTVLYVANVDGAFDVYSQPLDRDGRAAGAATRLTTGLAATSTEPFARRVERCLQPASDAIEHRGGADSRRPRNRADRVAAGHHRKRIS